MYALDLPLTQTLWNLSIILLERDELFSVTTNVRA